MFYYNIYLKLCESRKILKEKYGRGSGLHAHRIIPGHTGGEYNHDNITYLTPREHQIAHYLLWKIYKNPNDLRSMYMLGAHLTSSQRRIIGEFCRDNKIGVHKIHGTDYHKEYSIRGRETQKRNFEEHGNKNSFYYWSTEDGRRERSSIGGKASWKKQKEERNGLPNFISNDLEIRKVNASKNASLGPKFPVTDGKICKKLFSEKERKEFLEKNKNFKSGGRPYIRKNKEKGHWMNDGNINKVIKKSFVVEYEKKGWVRGRLKKRD